MVANWSVLWLLVTVCSLNALESLGFGSDRQFLPEAQREFDDQGTACCKMLACA